MRYSSLRQENGVTYITLEQNQEIDRTVTYQNGVFTFNDPDQEKGRRSAIRLQRIALQSM